MAKLRVIELFAGIGAQAQALNRIGADWESVDMVEIDPYCVTAYNAIFKTDYKPQDITKVEHLKPCDMLTYSFPCTDISTAGKQLGLSKGSGTRSSLLHEVARLLDDYEKRGELPKYLIMENVKNLVGKKFKADFDEWVAYLKAKGYETYWKVLNSCDYGVPQHRERVIAISILSENGENEDYEFPEPIPLTKRLKDMLEENVDEKYYITNAAVLSRLNSNYECRKNSIVQGGGICRTLTAREYKEPTCVAPSESEDEEAMTASTAGTSSGRILTVKKTNCKQVGMLSGGKWDKMHDISRRVYDTDGVAPTIHTMGGEIRK